MDDLKDIADGLLALVEGDSSSPPPPPALTEEVAGQVATAMLDYVLSQMEGDDSAELLGEAVVMGAYGAAIDMQFDGDVIAEAAVGRLEAIARHARALMEGESFAGAAALSETAPSDQQKALRALKAGKKKLKQVASEFGGDVKAASAALRALQKAGKIDYNLKTGYSVA